VGAPPIYLSLMTPNRTLLCIHRDPSQLGLLEEHGYQLLTAANGHEGLRLFMSRPVDAIVLEYHLGLLDGATIADEIKQVRPEVPIVMLVDHVDLPSGALKAVDALVAKSDGPHFLLAIVHFVLSVKPARRHHGRLRAHTPAHLRRPGRSRAKAGQGETLESPTDENDAAFSPGVWRSIRAGTVQF
jgi:DNA-binding response OmpR family regulator